MKVAPVSNITGRMVYQKNQSKRKGKPHAEAESVWARYGSDEDYKEWCRKRPSAYSGKNGGVIYAHYRTAANSGVGIKPPYSGIPLTQIEHSIQHRIGTFSFMARDRWEALVEQHLKAWATSTGKPLHWEDS